MSHIHFILGSSSPRRLVLLKDIGITPDQVIATNIDEQPKKQETPRGCAIRLAREKLLAIPSQTNPTLVLTADTVVGCGRRILPKASNNEEVRDCLKLLSARRHHVYTAVAVLGVDKKIRERVVDSVVIFNQLTDRDIEDYVRSEEGLGKAGGYAIQGRAAAFIRYISGSFSNIVGLPLFETSQLLKVSRGALYAR